MAKLHREAHLAGRQRGEEAIENRRIVAKRRRALEEDTTEPRPERAGDAQEVRERIADVLQPPDVGDPLRSLQGQREGHGVSSLQPATSFSVGMR